MRHTETPVKVLMIAGLERNGSTILDLVLGNHPQIESVGELGNLMHNGWVSRERLRISICTCGKRLDVPYVEAPEEACPFWSGVRREWVERTDPDSESEELRLTDKRCPELETNSPCKRVRSTNLQLVVSSQILPRTISKFLRCCA